MVRTIAYFDLFDYPLTATEIWKFLYHPELPETERRLLKVSACLDQSEYLHSKLSVVEAFYCFKGRESIVAERKRRNNRVDHQMRKVMRMVHWLRIFPWIKMIAIISSLPLGNVKQGSDIDLFIVSKKDSIWVTRLFTAGFLKLLRQRPDESRTKDRFCLSFFITEDALGIDHAAFGPDDIAFQYYIQSCMPLYDPDHIYPKFLDANQWLSKYLPNARFQQLPPHLVERPRWLRMVHRSIDIITWPFFNGLFSDWYCNLQLRILPQRLKTIANIDSRVIISDQMLKFHDKDNRHELLKQWRTRVQSYA